MKRSGRIQWYYDTLTPSMRRFAVTANVAIAEASRELAKDVERWMKENAKWDDRSGDAREGLKAEAKHEGFRQVIDVYHSVDYGIWLEVRWDGKYAIIGPALDHFETAWVNNFVGLLDKTNFVGGV